MARLNCAFTTPAAASIANGASAHVLQLVAPSNQRLCVQSISLFGDSSSPTLAGVDFRIYRHTAAGTASSAGTPAAVNGGQETPRAVCNYAFSAAPTNASAPIEYGKFNPQSGYLVIYPLGQEIIVPGGAAIGVYVTNNSGAPVNVMCKIGWEE